MTPSNQRSENSSSLDEIKDSDQSSHEGSSRIIVKKSSLPSQRSSPARIRIEKNAKKRQNPGEEKNDDSSDERSHSEEAWSSSLASVKLEVSSYDADSIRNSAR